MQCERLKSEIVASKKADFSYLAHPAMFVHDTFTRRQYDQSQSDSITIITLLSQKSLHGTVILEHMEVITTPYCGKMLCIGEDDKNLLLDQSIKLARELAVSTKSTSCHHGEQWKQLKDKIGSIVHHITMNKDAFHMTEYKFQILTGTVLPYMTSMQCRMKLEPRRFQQINKILYLLCEESQHVQPQARTLVHFPVQSPHPATVLLLLDEVVRGIHSEAGWWQSELGTSLQHAVDMQWLPILQDHRLHTTLPLIFLFSLFLYSSASCFYSHV